MSTFDCYFVGKSAVITARRKVNRNKNIAMEPVATVAMISTVATYLAKKLKDNKSVQDFFSDFAGATVGWIRPLFLKEDNEYQKVIEDLMKNPDSPIKKQQVEIAIASHLEDQPDDETHLKAMFEQLQAKAATDSSISIIGSKNVVMGNNHVSGNMIVGDNNTTAPK